MILENHLHFIAASDDLSRQVAEFKSFTARRIIDLLKARGVKTLLRQLERLKAKHKADSDHQFWQEGSHPQIVESDATM